MDILRMGIWLGVLALCILLIRWLVRGMRRSGHEPLWSEMFLVIGTYAWWAIVLLEALFDMPIRELGMLGIIHVGISPFMMPAIALLTDRRREESHHAELIHMAAAAYTPLLVAIVVLIGICW